ncbi:IS66 family transposase, partial [Burkholderia ubonensis]|uniref:IS66 family transposase n=1 Tax=Burkholderia ubonensis TaxID=101571 RepID=UPI000AB49D2D
NLMRDALLESNLIYGDETTFQVLKEPGRRPQAKSYLWAQVNGSGPPVRMFSYSPGRGAQHAQKLYAGVQSGTVLMTDGYELSNGIAHDHQLVHLGCWAHYPELRFMPSDDCSAAYGRGRSGVVLGIIFVATLCEHGVQPGERACRSRCERNPVPRDILPDANGSRRAWNVARCTPQADADLLAMAPTAV